MKEKDTEQDGRLDALETSEATQDADITQLKTDIKNAGKVDDVTVGGVSVVENKVAKIPEIPSTDRFVPYEGATNNVNLGGYALTSGKIESGTKYATGVTPTQLLATSKSNGVTSASTLSGEGVGFGEIAGAGNFLLSMENSTETGRVVAKLSKIGGTSTELGSLKLADPVLGNEAATKKYVDDKVTSAISGSIKIYETEEFSATLNPKEFFYFAVNLEHFGISYDKIISILLVFNAAGDGIAGYAALRTNWSIGQLYNHDATVRSFAYKLRIAYTE